LHVISDLLLEVGIPPPAQRYGAVFIGPVEAARGMSFDTVFIPGLAERLFPRKIVEDPIILDGLRAELNAGLATNQQRLAQERLALGIAVGAAERRLYLSYPRLDLQQGRPRVPSFYALETIRAAEGRLPNFAELERRAETESSARIGWPAPDNPAEAIDHAEYDLAVLARFANSDPGQSQGTARYLLTTNSYLSRARGRYQGSTDQLRGATAGRRSRVLRGIPCKARTKRGADQRGQFPRRDHRQRSRWQERIRDAMVSHRFEQI